MKRSLAALLLVALPTFASELAVHVDLSDSVRAALERGQIKAVRIGVVPHTPPQDVKDGVVNVFSDVPPGKANVRAFIVTNTSNYAVDPKGVDVDVAPEGRTDVTVPVHSQFITGTVSLRGKPFLGHQMNIFPSDVNRENWGFAVPFEKGTFAFPLPHGGDWDLQLWWDRTETAPMPRFQFEGNEVHIEMPEGMITGRVVDDDGNGVAGVQVRATLDQKAKVRSIGAGVRTGDDGTFALDGLLGGTWTLTASSQAPLQVSIAEGARKDGVVIHLANSYKYSTKDIAAPSKP